jgi:hypothetical protein
MKVAFFTPRSVDPLHPRLIPFRNYFTGKGIQPVFINCSDHGVSLRSRQNWLSLWFFDLYAVSKCKPVVHQYDLVFITDLKYLPLVRYCSKRGKKTIYETIDHNVELRFYLLERKIGLIRILKRPIIKYFRKLEKKIALGFAADIIVNSNSLKQYFDDRAHTLYYTSPLEDLLAINDPLKQPAFIYLGAFSHEKGAAQILALSKKLSLPLIIYGDIYGEDLKTEVACLPNVHHTLRISSQALRSELEDLFRKYFLLGFSLIQPVHYSYEVQEANKEIDYLALGIPLLGNHRLPTAEKIDAGCGVFIDDPKLELKINDKQLRGEWSANGRSYYREKYSHLVFERNINSVLSKYIDPIKPS